MSSSGPFGVLLRDGQYLEAHWYAVGMGGVIVFATPRESLKASAFVAMMVRYRCDQYNMGTCCTDAKERHRLDLISIPFDILLQQFMLQVVMRSI